MEIEKLKNKELNIIYLNIYEIEERVKQRVTELLSNIKVPRNFAYFRVQVTNDNNRQLNIQIDIYHYHEEWHSNTSYLPFNFMPTKRKNIYKVPKIVSRANYRHVAGYPSISHFFEAISVYFGFNYKTVSKYKTFYTVYIYNDYTLNDLSYYCRLKESKWK